MTLQSKNIYIRPLTLDDTTLLLNLRVKNRKFLKLYEPIIADDHFTVDGQKQALEKVTLDRENDKGYGFGIFLNNSNNLIGRVSLSNVVRGAWQNCTIGYFMDEKMQGKGYMTAAVRLIVKFAFHKIGLHRVEAGVMPWNSGSVKVLEKTGFMYIGLSKKHININGKWEDHLLYSIISEDVLDKNNT